MASAQKQKGGHRARINVLLLYLVLPAAVAWRQGPASSSAPRWQGLDTLGLLLFLAALAAPAAAAGTTLSASSSCRHHPTASSRGMHHPQRQQQLQAPPRRLHVLQLARRVLQLWWQVYCHRRHVKAQRWCQASRHSTRSLLARAAQLEMLEIG
ncbi:hypothetical protein HaLaN_23021 [Haematococcus lacustris]|uniref:Uncharacterized protein n=1 Tax=Haematococcus lacustris TaxID=44745 RepID=A0A699ZV62_HAELA|nr:hypothetical protein HaLaN_23021 [Haematococcus lacustris]